MIGCNLSRFCLMIGEAPVDHPLAAVKLLQQKFGRKMAPVEVPAAQAVSSQNVLFEGDAIDIRQFPGSACGRSTAACISAPTTPSSRWTRKRSG